METPFRELEGRSAGYVALVAALGALVVAGWIAAHQMDTQGHHITGMSNQVVWGVPHVFAVFLIVAASGALNVASLSSVFGRAAYQPLARLSGLLAIALLVGGLCILVLDLGRPDRLVVAMTHYNFKSIFAWNIFLYTGFLLITLVYLGTLMERRLNRHTKAVGIIAFAWRLVLTSGTGCIFGFLVAREGYDAAILAPLFISISLAQGTAVFLLVLMFAFRFGARELDADLVARLRRLLAIFVMSVLYFVLVQHVTNLYAPEHRGIERFLLLEGGVYPATFWLGQIAVGSLIPLVLLGHPRLVEHRGSVAAAAMLVVIGGFAQLYVLIVGAQAYPLSLFPGMEIVASSFFDGVVAEYRPRIPELALGVGGLALSALLVVLGLKVLRFLPDPQPAWDEPGRPG